MAAIGVAADGPEFNDKGQLMRPLDYREWIFMSSGIGMTYGPAAAQFQNHPAADNVYVNPSAWREFKKTGTWPDKTIFILEIRYTSTNGSINRGGKFQTGLAAIEAAVRDRSRLGAEWGYFNFGSPVGGLRDTADAQPKGNRCIQCHTANGAVDGTFAQFYPAAYEVAVHKGTVRADYFEKAPPASPDRLFETIQSKGWSAAQPLVAEAKAKDPQAQILSESTLNSIASALAAKHKLDDAIAVMRQTAEAYPKSALAQASLAEVLMMAGQKSDAMAATRRGMELLAADSTLTAERRDAIGKALRELATKLGK